MGIVIKITLKHVYNLVIKSLTNNWNMYVCLFVMLCTQKAFDVFFRIVSLSLLSEEHFLQLIYLTTNPTNPRPPLTPYVAWLFAVWTFSLVHGIYVKYMNLCAVNEVTENTEPENTEPDNTEPENDQP